jgi:hypothetical protein
MREKPSSQNITKLGQGLFLQELTVGLRFRTFARTITETDLVNFISCTGMFMADFEKKIDERPRRSEAPAREDDG